MPSQRFLFKGFLFLISAAVALSFLIFIAVDYVEEEDTDIEYSFKRRDPRAVHVYDPEAEKKALQTHIWAPIILWWTPFTGDPGTYKKCGEHHCFMTVDRHYRKHDKTKTFMFYGTDLDSTDLPLPREPRHEWALLHEESPKNNYIFSHEPIMTLFNHTSTFKRESDYPLTTQYLPSLDWLTSRDLLVPTAEKNSLQQTSGLSPLLYVHSDCATPSDRDTYVQLMMKFINIDSYGKCVHNKDLPKHLRDPIEGMGHDDFYNLVAKYKFSFAFENALCDDYITEKLWRPLRVGSVPIILGSSKVKDFLPSNHSAIIVDEFKSVEALVKYIKFLNENDKEYNKYLEWKRTGITNKYLIDIIKNREWGVYEGRQHTKYQNFIDGFECLVCDRLHKNEKLLKEGKKPNEFHATKSHYGCPGPLVFDSEGVRKDDTERNSWDYEFGQSLYRAKAIRKLVDRGVPYGIKDVGKVVSDLRKGDLK